MNILLVAATKPEIQNILNNFQYLETINEKTDVFQYKNLEITVLISQVGMLATAFELGKIFNKKFDLALNVGITGSFNESLKIGDIVHIHEEIIADFGAENDSDFISIFDLNLVNPNALPFENGLLKNPSKNLPETIQKLPAARGLTVNKVHGNEKSIQETYLRHKPDTESMEGAAFLYACILENVCCAQIRAVSNKVEKRNRQNWNIPLAIQNLNQYLLTVLDELAD